MGLLVPFSPRMGLEVDEGGPPFWASNNALMGGCHGAAHTAGTPECVSPMARCRLPISRCPRARCATGAGVCLSRGTRSSKVLRGTQDYFGKLQSTSVLVSLEVFKCSPQPLKAGIVAIALSRRFMELNMYSQRKEIILRSNSPWGFYPFQLPDSPKGQVTRVSGELPLCMTRGSPLRPLSCLTRGPSMLHEPIRAAGGQSTLLHAVQHGGVSCMGITNPPLALSGHARQSRAEPLCSAT